MGKLLGIARKSKRRAPMEELTSAVVDEATGLEGDFRGNLRERQITVVAREAWDAACADVGTSVPWTTRRANLFIEGVDLPRVVGERLRVGDVVLEVTGETNPCERMEEQQAGLRAALTPDWRGGVTCRVISGGRIELDETVELVPAE